MTAEVRRYIMDRVEAKAKQRESHNHNQIILACSEVGISVSSYKRWKDRFDHHGLDGLKDLPRSGRPRKTAQA